MVRIPAHVDELVPYKPGKPAHKNFDATGIREVVLSSNENNFGPSPLAMQAIREAAAGMHLYPDPTSTLLKEKLSVMLDVQPANLSVGNGSDSILYNMFKAFFEPGQKMLTSAGAFSSAKVYARLNNIPLVETAMLPGYGFDLEAMLEAIDGDTQVIYLVNPNNPTGAMLPGADLKAFLDRVPEHILVVIDEAYFDFATALSADYIDCSKLGHTNVIVLRTFSKAYGLAGLRLGYAIGPESLIQVLNKVKLPFDPNRMAQAAGLAALDDRDFLQATIDNNTTQRALLHGYYSASGLQFVPTYGNFFMLDLGTEARVEELFEALRARGVLTRRLASFGLPHCLRVSIGTAEDNAYYLQQLGIVISNTTSFSYN